MKQLDAYTEDKIRTCYEIGRISELAANRGMHSLVHDLYQLYVRLSDEQSDVTYQTWYSEAYRDGLAGRPCKLNAE